MTRHAASRRLLAAASWAMLCWAIAACSKTVPNTTLAPTTQFGRDIDRLWDILLVGGIVVFALVEAGLLYVIIRFRGREGDAKPRQIHGHTLLEITWTLIPALVLVFIAVPTVRTVFRTQAKVGPDALQVQVIGHQWWWEFRYPQYGVTTANELYLPVGRTVNFALSTADVLHSFWVPMLGGKRDLISNDTNYVHFKPESVYVWNGFCAEYCGASHANMRFRTFTVTPETFDRWIQHQKSPPAVVSADTLAGSAVARHRPPSAAWTGALPAHVVPSTTVPDGLTLANVVGDPARGAQLYKTGACIGCHVIQGVSPGVIGPNLTHVGSRTTIGAGLYPNEPKYLALWIKNAPRMKPGSLMPPMGRGIERTMGQFDDQQIADIAAYLASLK
jgi:cytochrome c oxidase subunit 2